MGQVGHGIPKVWPSKTETDTTFPACSTTLPRILSACSPHAATSATEDALAGLHNSRSANPLAQLTLSEWCRAAAARQRTPRSPYRHRQSAARRARKPHQRGGVVRAHALAAIRFCAGIWVGLSWTLATEGTLLNF